MLATGVLPTDAGVTMVSSITSVITGALPYVLVVFGFMAGLFIIFTILTNNLGEFWKSHDRRDREMKDWLEKL